MQQLKQIQQELGETPLDEEIAKLKEKASKKKWSKEVEEHFERELNKLQRMNTDWKRSKSALSNTSPCSNSKAI